MTSLNKHESHSLQAQFKTTNDEDNHNIVFQSIYIKSTDFIVQEISKIGETLSTVNTNWKERVACFSRICGFIANDNVFENEEYFNALFDGLRNIRDGLAIQCAELRSAVVKEACKFLCYLAIRYDNKIKNNKNENNCTSIDKSKVSDICDFLIPFLLKRLIVSILAISHSTNVCLRTIIKYVPINQAIYAIIDGTKVKKHFIFF